MSKEKVVSIDQNSEKLADKGLWNPDLIAEITCVTGARIITNLSAQSQGFYLLRWVNNSGRTEVIIEIQDRVSSMIVNIDRFRTQKDELALDGIAAKYGLQYGECNDEERKNER
jgi:hypothetical protein|tara:strand:+ start:529 stop:870 length:342 start_codon:yes stop_codon:yes gene_type:complete